VPSVTSVCIIISHREHREFSNHLLFSLCHL
jgi:hypothetical protein